MTKRMGTASTHTSMGLSMKVIGKMISSTDTALRLGLMDLDTRVITRRARSMAEEHMCGAMGPNMSEIGSIIRSMVRVSTHG